MDTNWLLLYAILIKRLRDNIFTMRTSFCYFNNTKIENIQLFQHFWQELSIINDI